MRGAAMSLKAAASGFVIFLLSVPVVQGHNDWGVTYTSTQICALKGSPVDIRCTYIYPSRKRNKTTKVRRRLWFTKGTNDAPVDLRTDSEYSGRVQYLYDNNDCILRITDLRESDSAEYKFRFITNQSGGSFTGSPGVTLSVTDLQVQVGRSSTQLELKCHSSCNVADRPSYVWYNNGEKMEEETSSYGLSVNVNDHYSCAVKGREDYRSPPVYAPKLPSVSVSLSGEIVEGSSVTLTCSSDANPAANYTWYKKNGNPNVKSLSKEPQLVFRSIQSSDSGQYYCATENELGMRTSEYIFIDVKYAPKVVTVSVSPPGDIIQFSSVTLTCSIDANPAAKYTWYKENGNPGRQPLSEKPQFVFRSIQSSDSGEYCCMAENKLGNVESESILIDVKYAPKGPSVSVSPSGEIMEGSSVTLTCSSDANPAAKYTWYKKNQTLLQGPEGSYHFTSISSEDRGIYHCKSENRYGQINSSSLFIDVHYAPKVPSVSVNPSGEIMEGSAVTLTCSSDANPAATCTCQKKNGNPGRQPLSEKTQLVFSPIRPSDSGEYYCTAENELGTRTSENIFIDVKYAPKHLSVSVSPSGEIVEGSSVTLTCSSDANPAAKYTWYRENQTPLQGPEGSYYFTSISSEDRGFYNCKSENQYGWINSSLFINVQYAPKLPSVSVSPSAEIVEGSSVILTCSSDANPAANYTWYKENEDSPKASGQIFTITDIRAEHSGKYYCETQNGRGRHNSTLHLTVVASPWKFILISAATAPAISLTIILISVFLWIIKKRTSKQLSEPEEKPNIREQCPQVQPAEQVDDLHYASVRFSENRADPIYSNVRPAPPRRHKEEEEMVEYSAVTFNSASTAWRSRSQEAAEDPAALYSTVNKPPKKH